MVSRQHIFRFVILRMGEHNILFSTENKRVFYFPLYDKIYYAAIETLSITNTHTPHVIQHTTDVGTFFGS